MELISQISPLFNIIIGFILGGVLFLLLSSHRSKKDGAYEKEKEIFYQSAKGGEYIHKNIHEEKLEKEFLRGIERGKEDERKKLTVTITPHLEIEDGVFFNTLYRGYTEQIIYNGFSIGEPRYYHFETIEKFKKENFETVVEKTLTAVENIANNYTSNLLTTIIKPKVIDQK